MTLFDEPRDARGDVWQPSSGARRHLSRRASIARHKLASAYVSEYERGLKGVTQRGRPQSIARETGAYALHGR